MTDLLDELQRSPAAGVWKEALLAQAEGERLAVFTSWRGHLALLPEPHVELLEEHVSLRYEGIARVLPVDALTFARGAARIADLLWCAAHPKPRMDRYSASWEEAHCSAVARLADRVARLVDGEGVRAKLVEARCRSQLTADDTAAARREELR